MLTPDAALPGDLDALKALVAHLTEQVTGQARTIELQDRQIETLRLQLAALRRQQFGRRSEKLQAQADQLELQLEELEARRPDRAAAERCRESDVTTSQKNLCMPHALWNSHLMSSFSNILQIRGSRANTL